MLLLEQLLTINISLMDATYFINDLFYLLYYIYKTMLNILHLRLRSMLKYFS